MLLKNTFMGVFVLAYMIVKIDARKGYALPFLRLVTRIISCVYCISVFFPRELYGGVSKNITIGQRVTACGLMVVLLSSLNYDHAITRLRSSRHKEEDDD